MDFTDWWISLITDRWISLITDRWISLVDFIDDWWISLIDRYVNASCFPLLGVLSPQVCL